ncbi:PH domain-containing protein [Streptomyces thermoalcalitolerans]|uniref:PH domain-containing protein n=1 Tax=Streptomyces thermoalcalitolerans TaxID=65605 RepID=A0ABP3YV53_9ACTN
MSSTEDVICRLPGRRVPWFFAGLGAVGAGVAVTRLAYLGSLLDPWLVVGLALVPVGVVSLHWATVYVRGDAYGLHCRTLLRRRSVPWSDVADLRVHRYETRHGTLRRVSVLLRDGRRRRLPLPYGGSPPDEDFDAKLDALRALLRRHGAPQSGHLPVIASGTAGYGGWVRPLVWCALLLAFAGALAWNVPGVAADERAWRSAAPCAAGTSAVERGEGSRESGKDCLSTLPAVIERTDVNTPKQRSWLYFTEGRPLERVGVPREAALEFRPGDRVEVTVWRGEVREVAGEHHVWRSSPATAGAQAVGAAVLALLAGYPAALVLLRLRGRRLPDDEVLPSALPFVGVLVVTALWLLPLCHLHPTSLLTSPVAITWGAVGSSVTLGLTVLAWRATRIRTPENAGRPEDAGTPGEAGTKEKEVFLSARFLEHTDYNPHGFGTHIVLGGGEPAVVPHSGPGRFAAKRIPVERLTLTKVRRVRGGDDIVPRDWHVAELDDGGEPVRLAAAPDDLTRIIRELGLAATAESSRT